MPKNRFSVLKMGLTGIAAWSAQASDRVRSISLNSSGFCDQRKQMKLTAGVLTAVMMHPKCLCRLFLTLPRGVIGNTRVFGTRIPGSSPGGVAF